VLEPVLHGISPELGRDVWAPEVAVADGAYWMYYSVGHDIEGHHIRVARSDSAAGPFVDLGLDLTPDGSFAIDAHPFRDDDGQWYRYFARDVLDHPRRGTHLAVAPLIGMTRLGPITRVIAPDSDWQLFEHDREPYGRIADWWTLEGPTVLRHGGGLVLLFSGGRWETEDYGVSVAFAQHPLGPWTHRGGRGRRRRGVEHRHRRRAGSRSLLRALAARRVDADRVPCLGRDGAGRRRQPCIEELDWAGGEHRLRSARTGNTA
jgi:hypothetical protein